MTCQMDCTDPATERVIGDVKTLPTPPTVLLACRSCMADAVYRLRDEFGCTAVLVDPYVGPVTR